MGIIHRIFTALRSADAQYEDQTSSDETGDVTMRDMLKFVEKQSEQNARLIEAVLAQGASQARTMESYIDLFKPKYVPSTTLEQREAMKAESTVVRESEWEGIESLQDFNSLTSGMGIPPEPPDSL
jgi:hypothetical protein